MSSFETRASMLSFFFLSSIRRHTRFSRDWSSDVCSSDLGLVHVPHVVVEALGLRVPQHHGVAQAEVAVPREGTQRGAGDGAAGPVVDGDLEVDDLDIAAGPD